MVTTVTSTERVREKEVKVWTGPRPLGGNGSGNGGNGGKGGNGGGGGQDDPASRYFSKQARLAMWMLLAAVLMMFTALTSAYIILSSSESWRPISIPRMLWLSTGLIITSSFTFQLARKNLREGDDAKYQRWLLLTALLGLGFVASQLLAWRQLVAQGIYMANGQHSMFFYVLTGAHGIHLLGGLLGLAYLLLRTWNKLGKSKALAKRRAAAEAVSLYWHFMDGLWIYLFLLLFLWR